MCSADVVVPQTLPGYLPAHAPYGRASETAGCKRLTKVRGLALAAASFMLGALVVVAIPAVGQGEPGVVHFTAAGDFGSEPETNAVLDLIKATDPDLNLAVGDLSYRATGAEQAWCDLVTSRVGAGFPFELLAAPGGVRLSV